MSQLDQAIVESHPTIAGAFQELKDGLAAVEPSKPVDLGPLERRLKALKDRVSKVASDLAQPSGVVPLSQ